MKIIKGSIIAGVILSTNLLGNDISFLQEAIQSTNKATIKLINNNNNIEKRLNTQEKINNEQDQKISTLEKKVDFLLKKNKIYNIDEKKVSKNKLITNYDTLKPTKKITKKEITKKIKKKFEKSVPTKKSKKIILKSKYKKATILKILTHKEVKNNTTIKFEKPINFIVKSPYAAYHKTPNAYDKGPLIGKEKSVKGIAFNKNGWVLTDKNKWIKGYILEPKLYPSK